MIRTVVSGAALALAALSALAQTQAPGLWEHTFKMKSADGKMEAAMAQMQKQREATAQTLKGLNDRAQGLEDDGAATEVDIDLRGRVEFQHLDDLVHGDRAMIRVPAVVVGDHGDGRVADLRLARELGLRHVGHADHAAAPLAVEVGFGLGRELRPFHADERLILMQCQVQRLNRTTKNAREVRIHRVAE